MSNHPEAQDSLQANMRYRATQICDDADHEEESNLLFAGCDRINELEAQLAKAKSVNEILFRAARVAVVSLAYVAKRNPIYDSDYRVVSDSIESANKVLGV